MVAFLMLKGWMVISLGEFYDVFRWLGCTVIEVKRWTEMHNAPAHVPVTVRDCLTRLAKSCLIYLDRV